MLVLSSATAPDRIQSASWGCRRSALILTPSCAPNCPVPISCLSTIPPSSRAAVGLRYMRVAAAAAAVIKGRKTYTAALVRQRGTAAATIRERRITIQLSAVVAAVAAARRTQKSRTVSSFAISSSGAGGDRRPRCGFPRNETKLRERGNVHACGTRYCQCACA